MKKRKRIEVGIQSGEYWFKSNEPIENYWALIDKENNNDFYTIFFIVHTVVNAEVGPESIIFDRLNFDCLENAIEGLRRNQYFKVDKFHSMFLPIKPPPPFIEWHFMKIYSKQGLWK
jgi:hypothetical protein